jgi:pSer/pThr/pTyr-binding forkhead associated (FHA) protein
VAAACEIGRDPAAALSLPDDALVSQHHARITPTDEGLVLEDLGSRNGTFVNGVRVAAPTLLVTGDRVIVGETMVEVEVEEVEEVVRSQPTGEHVLVVCSRGGAAYDVPLSEALEVGRDPTAGLPLPDDGHVSWRHARLAPHPDGVEVRDLESSNGTFVNDVRITDTVVVEAGGRVLVGDTTIEVTASARLDTAVVPAVRPTDTLVTELPATPEPAAEPAPPALVLEVVGADGAARELPLEAPLEVGRDPDAGLVLDDHLVSRLHVRLTPRDGEVTVEDLGSRNGTFVNGTRVEAPASAGPGDSVLVGGTTLVVGIAPAEAAASASEAPPSEPSAQDVPAPEYVVQVIEGWAAGRRFRLTGPLEVGRDTAAEVPLVDDDRVSPRHARLTPCADGAYVEDLESAEGTFVNDARIDERTLVTPGDRVLVGRTVFRILPPGSD